MTNFERKLSDFLRDILDGKGTCDNFGNKFNIREKKLIANAFAIEIEYPINDNDLCIKIVNGLTQRLVSAQQLNNEIRLPSNIILNILERLDLVNYFNVLGISNTGGQGIYASSRPRSSFRQELSMLALDKAQVNYKDPGNFLYFAGRDNDPIQIPLIDNNIDYETILAYYLNFYNEKYIEYVGKSNQLIADTWEYNMISSFPVYPNMIKCDLKNNLLTTFPIQPNMTECDLSSNILIQFSEQPVMTKCVLSDNRLTTFPVQPSMTKCKLLDNQLTSFPVQPSMTSCKLLNNQLTSFPEQPVMTKCVLSDNRLTSFPEQQKMTKCDLSNNQLTSFPVQPEMIDCNLSHNQLTTFPAQPKMIDCNLSHNQLTTFPVQPKMEICDLSHNQLTTFPVQPEMLEVILNNNQLTTFPDQPRLRHEDLSNNPDLILSGPPKCRCRRRVILRGEKYNNRDRKIHQDMDLACEKCNYTPPGMIYDQTAKNHSRPEATPQQLVSREKGMVQASLFIKRTNNTKGKKRTG